MTIKRLVTEFCVIFGISMVATATVTFLWNVIVHAQKFVDWETSFRTAILFGVILTWVKCREDKEKK